MGPSIFLLDANVFMEASRRYYALDIAPGFWAALVEHARSGQVVSIDKVKGEIDQGEDELKKWVNQSFYEWFCSTNQPDVASAYGKTMVWAHNQTKFTGAAQAEFASSPDGWLIAFALAKGYVVVTQEIFAAEIKWKIKIPNVCLGLGVPCIDTFKMLRILGVKLN